MKQNKFKGSKENLKITERKFKFNLTRPLTRANARVILRS